jgi:hypothetical protein
MRASKVKKTTQQSSQPHTFSLISLDSVVIAYNNIGHERVAYSVNSCS